MGGCCVQRVKKCVHFKGQEMRIQALRIHKEESKFKGNIIHVSINSALLVGG